MSEKNYIPTRKVGSGAIAGALTTVLIDVSTDMFAYPMKPRLAAAIVLLVMFAVSYIVPNVTPQDREDPPP